MSTKGPGRPRSERARQAVLDAARDLLDDGGFEALTMEAIARRAGVGKQTIYRWWPSKASVVADAVLAGVIPQEMTAVADTGSLRTDLEAWTRRLVTTMAAPGRAALVRALAAAVAADSDAGARLSHRLTGPLRQQLTNRLAAAVAAGQARADADLDAAADALVSVTLFLILAREPVTQQRASGLLRVVLDGIATRPAQKMIDEVNDVDGRA
ncbi:TetR/AcrR family transcriptional regulator, partial [Jatrophihabitans endophyticus]|uniref:TetR/AcrR family transcriptional regulator n=1 Tax=Jatrophihabitans endophyticus TaxID=1206085 RepID=UPI0019F6F81A